MRIASLAVCLKYFSNYWDTFHDISSYVFYYPGIIVLWYFYSSESKFSIQNLKKIISKYFFRILFLFVFYFGLIRPLQTNFNEKIIKPLIENNLNNEKKYKLNLNKQHTNIYLIKNKNHKLIFSIPFGQLYFLLLFVLFFKPYVLIKAISIYNLALIPFYAFAIFFFFHGYALWGEIIIINETLYRLAYGVIIVLKILRPYQLNLIFDDLKK